MFYKKKKYYQFLHNQFLISNFYCSEGCILQIVHKSVYAEYAQPLPLFTLSGLSHNHIMTFQDEFFILCELSYLQKYYQNNIGFQMDQKRYWWKEMKIEFSAFLRDQISFNSEFLEIINQALTRKFHYRRSVPQMNRILN